MAYNNDLRKALAKIKELEEKVESTEIKCDVLLSNIPEYQADAIEKFKEHHMGKNPSCYINAHHFDDFAQRLREQDDVKI